IGSNSLRRSGFAACIRARPDRFYCIRSSPWTLKGERNGPPTLWYLANVDGPQCHANQVVPATGLVDDAMTPARKKGIVDQAGKPDLLPCRGNGFPAIRRRLTHGRVRYSRLTLTRDAPPAR